MYKLFLTLRYLTRKKIVIFPILVVWLCVMMLIIVSSIMGGFIDRVRDANHDLYGDIIISGRSEVIGFPHYDEIRHGLEAKFPQIKATAPVVEAFGLLYVPSARDSRPAKLVGINPAEQVQVTQFGTTLFNQYKAPIQAADDLAPSLPADRDKLIKAAIALQNAARDEFESARKDYETAYDQRMRTVPNPKPDFLWLTGAIPVLALIILLVYRARRHRSAWSILAAIGVGLVGIGIIALGVMWPILFPNSFALTIDRVHRADLAERQALRTLDFATALPPAEYRDKAQLLRALLPPTPSFTVPPALVAGNEASGIPGLPADGAIIGSQFGFFSRDARGNFVRDVNPLYTPVILSAFPANNNGNVNPSAISAVRHSFTLIDDSHTGQFDVDQFNIYVPFEIAQQMAGLRADPDEVKEHPEAAFDPRCQQVLIRLKTPMAGNALLGMRAEIAQWVYAFEQTHPDMAPYHIIVQTWDEKQARYLSAVENEKVIIVFILGLMSLVVLVVIFLIFYQLVRDKTRDIGIIKAVGGSEEGVAGIFLTYGLFVGLVGGGLGLLSGILFVTHTNEIHEWIYRTTGVIIWDRSVYIFDRIPDKVHMGDCITYFAVALAAGILGAFIPAFVAGSQDPVQAVRYE